MSSRDSLVADVADYWRQAGLGDEQISDMSLELDRHLTDAEADGRSPVDVVGNTADFAESWAEAARGRPVASWEDVTSGRTERERRSRRDWIAYGIGSVAFIGGVAVAGQGGGNVDSQVWAWLWTVLAVVLGIGEIFTAGFFLLPFAIGAGAAAILGWIGANVIAQWLVFFGVSIFSMAFLRRYINRQDEDPQPRVGANRWVGEKGIVLESIDPHTGAGMARVLNEEWRVTSPGPIETGTPIIVTDVEGTRLVVEKLES